jgi:hypothetical protein
MFHGFLPKVREKMSDTADNACKTLPIFAAVTNQPFAFLSSCFVTDSDDLEEEYRPSFPPNLVKDITLSESFNLSGGSKHLFLHGKNHFDCFEFGEAGES